MKYALLTKEQFEGLYKEFANFLASQSIDKEQWDDIKLNKPEVAQQELEVFSDLIWEGVLTRTQYLEHFSKSHGFLFHCTDTHIESIVLKCLDESVDFLSQEGIKFLQENLFGEAIEIRLGKKPYGEDRNADVFSLIEQGSILSDGLFYTELIKIVAPDNQ